ncbi:MAG: hypothetical protein ACOYON_02735 [Fimbriimonas sp.]
MAYFTHELKAEEALEALKSVVPEEKLASVRTSLDKVKKAAAGKTVSFQVSVPGIPSSPNLPNPPSGDPLSDVLARLDELKGLLTGPFRGAPAVPDDVLRQVAEGVTSAEKALNEQNLLISGGTVEVSMNVGKSDVASATTKFILNISPKQPT